MNRIDELLGVATFAAAGMFASIAIVPVTAVVATAAAPRTEAQVVTADPLSFAPVIVQADAGAPGLLTARSNPSAGEWSTCGPISVRWANRKV